MLSRYERDYQFNSSSARDRPCGLRAFVEVFSVTSFSVGLRLRLRTAGAFEAVPVYAVTDEKVDRTVLLFPA